MTAQGPWNTGEERISLREAFGQALVKLGRKYPDFVVFDCDVAGGTCTNLFRESHPDRFFQFGIAEQNMFGAAAGFASAGVTVIATTYAVFASMRALEQARTFISYPRMNVKICASHVGVDAGPDGVTHQGVEDLGIYTSIPQMTVLSPADPLDVESCLEAAIRHSGPVYMRTGRSPVPRVLPADYRFQIGRGTLLREGDDAAVLATGIMLHRALEAAEELAEEGIFCSVSNIASLKPIDAKLIKLLAKTTGAVVTAEDHNVCNGLGSMVARVLSTEHPVPLEIIALPDTFAESGEPEDLSNKYGLTPDHIAQAVRRAVSRKEGTDASAEEDLHRYRIEPGNRPIDR